MSRIRRILSHIKPTRQPGFKHPWRQVAEMLFYLVFWPLSPIEYRAYRFGRTGIGPKQMRTYLRNTHATKMLRPRLNDREWAPLLSNKLLFNSYYKQRGLPVTTLYGMFHPLFGADVDGKPLRTAADLESWLDKKGVSQFVVKPLAGSGGSSVLVLEVLSNSGELFFEDRGGKRYTVQELVVYMSKTLEYKSQGFLLEERVVGHPEMARFNPSSLNTCRILTFLDKSGKAEILYAIMRIGGLGKNTDNWHAGGISAAVDKQTGIIGEGMVRPEFGGTTHTAHPGTGLTFAGETVPFWEETCELLEKAARLTPFTYTVGWDVAATPTGPVLIEANFNWSPFIIQAFHGGMLTPENREKFAQFGLRFP